MQVPYDEGVANRIGPESWVGVRKNAGQALTGDMQAGISSREKTLIQGADAINVRGRQYGPSRQRERRTGPAWSKTPSMHESFSHGNRESL